jgi:hypothetical protein
LVLGRSVTAQPDQQGNQQKGVQHHRGLPERLPTMTHMAVMVNLRAGIAPMDSQALGRDGIPDGTPGICQAKAFLH